MNISKTTINYAERRGWEVVDQEEGGVEFYSDDSAEWDFKVLPCGAIRYAHFINTEDMPAHVMYGEKQIREIVGFLTA